MILGQKDKHGRFQRFFVFVSDDEVVRIGDVKELHKEIPKKSRYCKDCYYGSYYGTVEGCSEIICLDDNYYKSKYSTCDGWRARNYYEMKNCEPYKIYTYDDILEMRNMPDGDLCEIMPLSEVVKSGGVSYVEKFMYIQKIDIKNIRRKK